MLIFSQVPWQRPERIGMPQQLADIGWSHAHFVHPGGGGSSRPMGSNASHHIGLIDSSQLAKEWDHAHIEELLPHQLIAVLEKVVCWLSCLAIKQCLLV